MEDIILGAVYIDYWNYRSNILVDYIIIELRVYEDLYFI